MKSLMTILSENAKTISQIGIVSELSGNEFAKAEKSLVEQVSEYFNSIGNNATNPIIGGVLLNTRGVKDSIAHGIGRKKAVAFAAVPAVIENGKIIDIQSDWKSRGYETFVVAARITINKEIYSMGVVITKNKATQKYYLHEVRCR